MVSLLFFSFVLGSTPKRLNMEQISCLINNEGRWDPSGFIIFYENEIRFHYIYITAYDMIILRN